MRRAALYVALALTPLSCDSESYGVATHCGREGPPDQWIRRISPDKYQIALDTNCGRKADLLKDLSGRRMTVAESDRDFDGRLDLHQ